MKRQMLGRGTELQEDQDRHQVSRVQVCSAPR